jgi:signal transduction histidine kinase
VPYHAIRDPDQIQALLDAVLSIESDLDLSAVLLRIVEAARTLTGATYGALGVIDQSSQGLAQFIHVGMADETVEAIGHLPVGEGILGLLILDPRPLRLPDLSAHPDAVGFPPGHPAMRSFLGMPVRFREEMLGNIYLTDAQRATEFSEADQGLLAALAVAAGIAIHNARLHLRLSELGLAADRERIARDLHDTVIQRLFATGLSLQSALPVIHDEDLHARVQDAVAELDVTIRQVRTAIFALDPPTAGEMGVRTRVVLLCTEVAPALGFEPEVRFAGAIDRYIDGVIAAELLATLREALSNAARHSGARHLEVELSVDDRVTLRVLDDGVGIDAGTPAAGPEGRGLANMADRAASLGGSLSLSPRPGGGTEVRWQVPLPG